MMYLLYDKKDDKKCCINTDFIILLTYMRQGDGGYLEIYLSNSDGNLALTYESYKFGEEIFLDIMDKINY